MKARVFFLTCILMMAPFVNLAEVVEATSGRALACSGTDCLNEALPDPDGSDTAAWPNGEWMEIYNSGNVPVNVLNWKLINSASKTLNFDSVSIVGFEAGNSLSLIHI